MQPPLRLINPQKRRQNHLPKVLDLIPPRLVQHIFDPMITLAHISSPFPHPPSFLFPGYPNSRSIINNEPPPLSPSKRELERVARTPKPCADGPEVAHVQPRVTLSGRIPLQEQVYLHDEEDGHVGASGGLL